MTTRLNVVDKTGEPLCSYEAGDITPAMHKTFQAKGQSYACACGVPMHLQFATAARAAHGRLHARGKHAADCAESIAAGRQGKWRQLEQAMADQDAIVVHLRLRGVDRTLPMPPLVDLVDGIKRRTGGDAYHVVNASSVWEFNEACHYVRALNLEYRMRGNTRPRSTGFVLHKNMLRPMEDAFIREEAHSLRGWIRDVLERAPLKDDTGALQHYPALAYLFRLHMHRADFDAVENNVTYLRRKDPPAEFWRQRWVSDVLPVQDKANRLDTPIPGVQTIKGPFPWDAVRFSVATNDPDMVAGLEVCADRKTTVGLLAAVDENTLRDAIAKNMGREGEGRVLDIPLPIKNAKRQLSWALPPDDPTRRAWPSMYKPILG